ncbi:MAG: nuclear transport factor 2 family protein [Armatimonas sp.]
MPPGQTSPDFDAYLKKRKEASDAFIEGDFSPLDQVSTHSSPATIFGPKGDCVQGADEVNAVNAKGAESFAPGGENDFEIMHQHSEENLAYWVGIQHSVVHLKGKEKPVPMDLRVTEIFRKEKGQWKLVHRHADPLKEGT